MDTDVLPGDDRRPRPWPEKGDGRADERSRRRGRRVVLLLALLWILNGFDLAFTLIARSMNDIWYNPVVFTEANPIVARALEAPYAVFTFKLGAVAFATTALFMARRRPLAEIACWGLCVVYVALAFVWMDFFNRYQRAGVQAPAAGSYVVLAELERPRGQGDGPVAAHVDQQAQRHAVDHQA